MFYGTLSNGVRMPLVGLGTYKIPNDEIPFVLDRALDFGYRKIDTARYYANEDVIGRFLMHAGVPREELFISTKMDVESLYHTINILGHRKRLPLRKENLRHAFFRQLERLHTNYIDMYMLHAAIPKYYKYWDKEVRKLYKEGYIRSFGVCSFSKQDFELYKSYLGNIPMMNQIEISPYNTNKEIIAFCQERTIQVEAFASLGTTKKNPIAAKDLLENKTIVDLTKKYNKSSSQVILRWILEQGISIIPKARQEAHLRENMDLFDFELSKEDMLQIDALDKSVYHRYFRQQ